MNLLKTLRKTLLCSSTSLLLIGTALAAEEKGASPDWPNLNAYRAANAQVQGDKTGKQRVVFMGDSITEFWSKSHWDAAHINRGISGQTSPQMLLRFRQDVIDLHPTVVVILAGTNDVAGNTGPATNAMIANNIASMVQLAQANGIRVVLASVLPASSFYWNSEARPSLQIVELNQELQSLAKRYRCVYLDYFAPMVDEQHGLKKTYSNDGVHPNEAGYAVMAELARQAIARATQFPVARERRTDRVHGNAP
jgi:lysophospholipase L1-like esterase